MKASHHIPMGTSCQQSALAGGSEYGARPWYMQHGGRPLARRCLNCANKSLELDAGSRDCHFLGTRQRANYTICF